MPKRMGRGATKRRDENAGLDRHAARSRAEVRVLTGAQVARRARDELAEITGLEAGHVTSLKRSDAKTWNVTVELLELRRVPDTDDLIGSYQAELDDTGELLAYERVGRHSRCQTQLVRRSGDLDGHENWDRDV